MNKRFFNQQPIWNSPLVREDVIDISGEQRNFINQIIVSTINCDYIRGKAKSVYSHTWEGFIVLPLSIEFLSIFGCHLQSCKLFQELHMYIFQLQLSSAMGKVQHWQDLHSAFLLLWCGMYLGFHSICL